MLDRCAGRAGATETPIGYLPRAQDLDTHGLDLKPDALHALLAVDPALWRQEVGEIRDYLARFGARLPPTLLAELTKTKQRLG